MEWAIDPIKSFSPDEEGGRERLLIFQDDRDLMLKDETLWKAGKEAFDILLENAEGELTQADLDEFVRKTPEQLIRLWNEWVDVANNQFRPGGIEFSNKETGQVISHFEHITIEPDSFWAPFKIEPSISQVDDFFANMDLCKGEAKFPFNRKLIAAYFTILHVDIAAKNLSAGHVSPDTYRWVTRWMEKLKRYNETKQAIESRQEHMQREKSRAMNSQRHASRNKAVSLVTTDWSKRKTDFRSTEKAGQYYADWLSKKGFEFEPRTITGWIRKFAKENNIILR